VQFTGDMSKPSPFHNGAPGARRAEQTFYAGYFQDEWRMRPNLTMSYGLRYEYFSVLREAQDRAVIFDTVRGILLPPSTPFYRSSRANMGPRLAFSWSPKGLENRTVLRIGAGYYYGPGQTEDLLQPIESDRVTVLLGPGAAYPIDPPAIQAAYDINDSNLRYQPRAYAPGYRIPERILSYTLSLQQQLPLNALLTVGYVGSQGRNLFLRSIANRIIGVDTEARTGRAIIHREFGDRFAEVDMKTSGGNDNYNALQVSLNRRFNRGLTVSTQWSWGHSIGTSAGSNEARTSQDPYNFRAERGNNNFDVRHSFNLSALYALPFFNDHRLLGGWEIGGLINARTGLPVDVNIQRNDVVYVDQGTGLVHNQPVLAGGRPVSVAVINTPGGGASRNVRRPDLVAGVSPFLTGGGRTSFLNPAAFAMPAPGLYGNLARNVLHGPGLAQMDITLQKKIPLSEKVILEFRGELYNLFNRANFANPPSLLANALGTGLNRIQPGQAFTEAASGGAFGVLNRTVERTVGLGTSRQAQLSLRLTF